MKNKRRKVEKTVKMVSEKEKPLKILKRI